MVSIIRRSEEAEYEDESENEGRLLRRRSKWQKKRKMKKMQDTRSQTNPRWKGQSKEWLNEAKTLKKKKKQVTEKKKNEEEARYAQPDQSPMKRTVQGMTEVQTNVEKWR